MMLLKALAAIAAIFAAVLIMAPEEPRPKLDCSVLEGLEPEYSRCVRVSQGRL